MAGNNSRPISKPAASCIKPSRGASKADMLEFHRERMKSRKIHRWVRTATHRDGRIQPLRKGRSWGIWPEGKVAKPGRMG